MDSTPNFRDLTTQCIFTPDADFNGQTSFQYTVSDGDGGTDTATVTITVGATNDAPEAQDDGPYTTDDDVTLNVSAAEGVLANDQDPDSGDSLTASLVDDVENGTLTLNSDGSFTYTPDENFTGDVSFTYKANDGTTDSNVSTVTIRVVDDNTAPMVAGVTPAENATKVARNANVTATFSEAMNPATLNTSTVTLAKVGFGGRTTPVQATVTLSSDGKTVTLDPSTNLGGLATYRATIKGGSGGAKDLAGNPLAADKVWSFKTGFR